MDVDIKEWHPVGFAHARFSSRGWGTLIESVVNKPITFAELVSRYNYLLSIQVNESKEVVVSNDKQLK
jgi:hypothetical protein